MSQESSPAPALRRHLNAGDLPVHVSGLDPVTLDATSAADLCVDKDNPGLQSLTIEGVVYIWQ
jgi:hypothetical protein